EKIGESLFLYPKPNYDMEAGLEIYFTRPPFYFEVGEDETVPGFAETFHLFIPLWNAFHYASSNVELVNKAVILKGRLDEMTERIKKHYGSRRKRKRLTV